MAPALPLVFATLGDEITHLLQVERPAMSLTEVVELVDEGSIVGEENSSVVERCLKKESSQFQISEKYAQMKESCDRR